VVKHDVGTAKNYLDAQEIDTLNRITVMFLDQAEFRAQRRQNIRMRDWAAILDKFLGDTELPILKDAGSVAHDAALAWAGEQYDAFAERRRLDAEAAAEGTLCRDFEVFPRRTLESSRKKPESKVQKAVSSWYAR